MYSMRCVRWRSRLEIELEHLVPVILTIGEAAASG